MCNLVRGDIVVLFYCRKNTGQLLDIGPGFLAAVCHVDDFDEVLPGSLSLLRWFSNEIPSCLDGIRGEGVFIVQLDVVLVPGSTVPSKARDV